MKIKKKSNTSFKDFDIVKRVLDSNGDKIQDNTEYRVLSRYTSTDGYECLTVTTNVKHFSIAGTPLYYFFASSVIKIRDRDEDDEYSQKSSSKTSTSYNSSNNSSNDSVDYRTEGRGEWTDPRSGFSYNVKERNSDGSYSYYDDI